MIILTTAVGYKDYELSIFWDSLMGTGYSGKVAVVSNDCKVLEDRGVIMIPEPESDYPISVSRYFAYRDFLKDVDEPVIITDIKDVVFQKNPEEYMPIDGVNVFEEAEGKTIGDCYYNSLWMKNIGVEEWNEEPILCSGITSGILSDYLDKMCSKMTATDYPVGNDQGIHNDVIYSGFPSNIHRNEHSEVYTVGHIPLESVNVNEEGFITNKNGDIPCMVHMYDRHVNLTVAVIKRLDLKVVTQ